jgi:hypothetical protein
MSCGFGSLNHNDVNQQVMEVSFSSGYKTKWLYTAYLGRVRVKVGTTSNKRKFNMECKGVGSASDIVVREIDSITSRIDPNARSTLVQLANKPPAVVDIRENKETFYKIQKMEAERAIAEKDYDGLTLRQSTLDKFSLLEPNLSKYFNRLYANIKYDPEELRALYVKNSVVDIHFNTILYLEFLQEKLNRPSINNGKLLLSVFNIPELDNAFFTGEYMVYGNGKDAFYPLTSTDVAGHELGHGLVQATAGLEYQGHSGALNESFADVLGVSFEFWLYKKFNSDDNKNNDILGESDWLIGEDIGKTLKYLRNMMDPTKAQNPQPKTLRGQYWLDPNGQPDYGGVHVNSGVSNHCFYLLSEKIGQEPALSIFYNCLLKLSRNSDFIDFRNTLVECSPENVKATTQSCLDIVGLNSHAYSKWDKSPPANSTPSGGSPELPRNNPRTLPQNPAGGVPYPNQHIPFQRTQCCPHCLCLQGFGLSYDTSVNSMRSSKDSLSPSSSLGNSQKSRKRKSPSSIYDE